MTTREHTLMVQADTFGNCLRPNGVETGLVSPIQPPNLLYFGDDYEEITFTLTVGKWVGADIERSLGAKFQFLQSDSALGNQYAKPLWYDLDETMIANDIVEGKGWSGPGFDAPLDGGFGTVADRTTTTPVTIKRTVRNFGRSVRVCFDRPAANTTSNGWSIGLTMIGKVR